jgi:hypothetical protein
MPNRASKLPDICSTHSGARSRSGLRSDAHPEVHHCVPDDEAAGGVHGEGVGVEVLTITRQSALAQPAQQE